MLQNAFAHLQKIGKSLILPVSVLPVAGILLGVGSAEFSWLPAVVSDVMAEAVAYGIMVKTIAVVAPLILHLTTDEVAVKHLADTGVWGGLSPGLSLRRCLTASTASSCRNISVSLPVNALCRLSPVCWRFWSAWRYRLFGCPLAPLSGIFPLGRLPESDGGLRDLWRGGAGAGAV